ncbi:MAG: cupin domain-containing protein [Nitrospirae bacterium]|nr:cupin domain-containing protein [Nitrospirota bacterium]
MNRFRGYLLTALAAGWVGILIGATGMKAEGEPKPKATELLRVDLEGAAGMEAIVQSVEMPPGGALPKHYHPGREFGYLLEGEATLWMEKQPERSLKAGDLFTITPGQVHTAKTGKTPAKVLVFRVHPKGQPVAINAE